ncbi:creatininase family protein [Chloroflexota bacterium]|nr:creatininase family protein [Chloroflexota bacterium]
MRFEDTNWMGVEEYLKKDDRVMLVLGACEQHGYLSLLTDVKIPQKLGEAASKASGVLLAPPLNFGCSPYFLSYPGTINLRLHTYLDLVEDILRSLYGAGFHKVLILNGHGGNTPVRSHLVELANELPDLMMRWYAWWTRPVVAQISQENGLINQHANWEEAFDFTIVSDMPKEIKSVPKSSGYIHGKDAIRKIYDDGMYGGAYQADPAIMQEIFDACLAEILEWLKFE